MDEITYEGRRKAFNHSDLGHILLCISEFRGDSFSSKQLLFKTGMTGFVLRWYLPHLLDIGAIQVIGRRSRKYLFHRCFNGGDIDGLLGRMEECDMVRRKNE